VGKGKESRPNSAPGRGGNQARGGGRKGERMDNEDKNVRVWGVCWSTKSNRESVDSVDRRKQFTVYVGGVIGTKRCFPHRIAWGGKGNSEEAQEQPPDRGKR